MPVRNWFLKQDFVFRLQLYSFGALTPWRSSHGGTDYLGPFLRLSEANLNLSKLISLQLFQTRFNTIALRAFVLHLDCGCHLLNVISSRSSNLNHLCISLSVLFHMYQSTGIEQKHNTNWPQNQRVRIRSKSSYHQTLRNESPERRALRYGAPRPVRY